MADAGEIAVNINRVMRTGGMVLRIRISGVRVFRIRIAIGCALIKAAARIMNCASDIQVEGGRRCHTRTNTLEG